MKAIIAAIALLATPAAADFKPDSVSIPLYVNHANYIYDFNEGLGNNLGVLLTWDVKESVQFTAGAYNNSFSELSATAYIEYEPIGNGYWSAGIFAGFATYDAETTPIPMPSRIGGSDVVAIGGARLEVGNAWLTYTPSGAEGRNIITSGVTFGF
jgi:hypothetical protein